MAAEGMSMTIFVFLYVLTLRIFNKMLSKAAVMIIRILNKSDPKEDESVAQMKKLIAEQQLISAQDEFAKYARLQRKIDKLKDEVNSFGSERRKAEGKHKLISKVLIMMSIFAIHITFLIMYRKDPVIILPHQWFYPFTFILSLPTGISGAIGLPCWMLTCNKIIEKII
ncbi:tail-anchored protein insertion receptor WRB-like [Actinia tenebrosa]|uniref:Guided entry of tail-anchored proteins factor 1 n=1 Tax=Actinia tenebrosa TaxID=6105 RepID=A0A6P8IVE3_ACTTE|nr:tail-anchored protein insertion receptor WRB-like [Actinia tenebrosa]